MSTLRRSDHDLHYSDSSHRWIAPPNVEQSAWEAKVRAHLDHHLLTMGGGASTEPNRGLSRVPRPRRAAATPGTSETLPLAPPAVKPRPYPSAA